MERGIERRGAIVDRMRGRTECRRGGEAVERIRSGGEIHMVRGMRRRTRGLGEDGAGRLGEGKHSYQKFLGQVKYQKGD
jgi:hypothetical protein